MVIFDLNARPFQIAVVVERLQPPQKLLRTAAQERRDLRGTEKTMPVDKPDDVMVALGEFDGNDRGSAFEAWKTGHRVTMRQAEEITKA